MLWKRLCELKKSNSDLIHIITGALHGYFILMATRLIHY